jgi:outer membrane protein OmpA-like peptidoglycan-associated protein/tetratricopeptide (TPR) repeat protein
MNRKVLYQFVLVLLVSAVGLGAVAQKGKHRLADRYISEFNFKDAAAIYEDILEKNAEDVVALRKGAMCLENIGRNQKAENYLAALSKLDDKDYTDLFSYAAILKKNKKYEEALNVYRACAELKPDDKQVQAYLEEKNWTNKILRDSSRYMISAAKINSAASDFAPGFVDNMVIFSSARGEGKGKRNIYAWNDQSYLNLYYSTINIDSNLVEAKVIENKANSRFHEGTAAFDAVSREVYITRNNFNKGKKKKSKKGALNLGIYYGKYENAEIGKLQDFEYNDPEFSVGHPTVSPTGNELYFVSDMPGGKGGTDIYRSIKEDAGWGKPENLLLINTPGDEKFPFCAPDSMLYFSSDGYPGLGGLDLFFVDLGDPGVLVRNMGYPVNTAYDDFGLCIFENGRIGYFSSNRPGGMGDDDIYEYRVSPPSELFVNGTVRDKETMAPIPLATISVVTAEGIQPVATSNSEGYYEFSVDFSNELTIKAEKESYFPEQQTVAANPASSYLDNVDFTLEKFDYSVQGRVLYAENDLPAEGAKLTLFDSEGKVVDSHMTEPDGKYFFGLKGNSVYTLECTKFSYPDQEIELDTRDRVAKEIYSDFRLFKLETGTVVRMDNIYYDYNSAEIRPDAARELDKLVNIMEDNPTMTIELGSHTDSRGGAPYNKNLSKKRAKSAIDYMASKGIANNRLKSKGYGETKLLNKCKDGVECSEEEHQLNRRTEFKILDI